MEVTLTQGFAKKAVLVQHYCRHRDRGDALDKHSGKNVNSEHRAEPFRLQRHEPVESAPRERDCKERKEQHRVPRKATMDYEAKIGVFILFKRQFPQEEGERCPE